MNISNQSQKKMTKTKNKFIKNNGIVCACFNVKKSLILEYMKQPNSSIEGLEKETNIGTKCSACLIDLELLLDDIHFKNVTLRPDIKPVDPHERKVLDAPVERLDSAFFMCSENVKTFARISNFPNIYMILLYAFIIKISIIK